MPLNFVSPYKNLLLSKAKIIAFDFNCEIKRKVFFNDNITNLNNFLVQVKYTILIQNQEAKKITVSQKR